MTPELPNHERHEPKQDETLVQSIFLDEDESDTVPAVPSEKRRRFLEERYGRPEVLPGSPPPDRSGPHRT